MPLKRPTFFDSGASDAPHTATSPSGKAEACKAFIPGSNPGVASRNQRGSVRKRVGPRDATPAGITRSHWTVAFLNERAQGR